MRYVKNVMKLETYLYIDKYIGCTSIFSDFFTDPVLRKISKFNISQWALITGHKLYKSVTFYV